MQDIEKNWMDKTGKTNDAVLAQWRKWLKGGIVPHCPIIPPCCPDVPLISVSLFAHYEEWKTDREVLQAVFRFAFKCSALYQDARRTMHACIYGLSKEFLNMAMREDSPESADWEDGF